MPTSSLTTPACGTPASTKPLLKLGLDPVVWLERVERKFALTVVDVSHEMMVNAALLPLYHRDPADRFIIATALKMDLPVVTNDDNFPKYGVSTVI